MNGRRQDDGEATSFIDAAKAITDTDPRKPGLVHSLGIYFEFKACTLRRFLSSVSVYFDSPAEDPASHGCVSVAESDLQVSTGTATPAARCNGRNRRTRRPLLLRPAVHDEPCLN
jgi:hypothetical protein